MRILLIQPPLKKIEEFPYLPLSLISIGTEIMSCGNDVRILDLNLDTHVKRTLFDKESLTVLDNAVAEYQPHVIGITCYCSNFPIVVCLSKHLKNKWPNIPLVLGGPHISLTAFKALKTYQEIDVIVIGEGEFTCRELFSTEGLVIKNVNGILSRQNGQIIESDNRPLVDNLDDLKPIDYGLVDMESYLKRDAVLQRHIFYEVGRGCPFNCAFCSTSLMWGRRYRVKSVECVVRDVCELHDRYGIEMFEFLHDHLLVDANYVRALCETLIHLNLKIQWSCSARADSIKSDLLALMKESGCNNIYMGIETGTSQMQATIGKNLNVEKSLATVKMCADKGIGVNSSFIIGLPNEKPHEFEKTINTALEFKLGGSSNIQIHMFLPYPMTQLYEEHSSELIMRTNLPDFISWNEKELPLQDTIKANAELHSSFYYIPTSSGNEVFLMDAERFLWRLLNFYPRSSLYLVSKKGFSFNQLVTKYMEFGNSCDTRRDDQIINLGEFIKKLLINSSNIHEVDVMNTLVRYEQIIQMLTFMGISESMSKCKNRRDNDFEYYRNKFIQVEGFKYDIKTLLTMIDLKKFEFHDMESAKILYAFVLWKGGVEIYKLGGEEFDCINSLPQKGTLQQYHDYFSIKGYDENRFEKSWEIFTMSHVIIKNYARKEGICC